MFEYVNIVRARVRVFFFILGRRREFNKRAAAVVCENKEKKINQIISFSSADIVRIGGIFFFFLITVAFHAHLLLAFFPFFFSFFN